MHELISLIILRHKSTTIETHIWTEFCIIKCYE